MPATLSTAPEEIRTEVFGNVLPLSSKEIAKDHYDECLSFFCEHGRRQNIEIGRIKQVCRLYRESIEANDLHYVHIILHRTASPELIHDLLTYSDKIFAISIDFKGIEDNTAQHILKKLPHLTSLRRLEARFLMLLSPTAKQMFHDSVQEIANRGDQAPSTVTLGLSGGVGNILRNSLSSTLRVTTLDVGDLQRTEQSRTWNRLEALYIIFPHDCLDGIATLTFDTYPLVRKLVAKIMTMGFRTENVFLRFLNVVELTIEHQHPSYPPHLPTMPNLSRLTCNLGTAKHLAFHHQPSLVDFVISNDSSTHLNDTETLWEYLMELDEEMWSLSLVTFTPLWKKITLKDIKRKDIENELWNCGMRAILSTWSMVLLKRGVSLVGGDDVSLWVLDR